MELAQNVSMPPQGPPEDQRYSYTPIANPDIIRILTLNPGLPGDPLSGELHHTASSDLEKANAGSDDQNYEATSYVWGVAIYSRKFRCPGGLIPVTSSLEEALLHVRLSNRPRRPWIDGFCFNQQDVRERGHQVKLMGRVYSNAAGVLIWLGYKSKDKYIFRMWKRAFAEGFTGKYSQWVRSADVNMHYLFEQKWFKRLWVVQECLLSKTALILWGDEEIDLEIVLAVLQPTERFKSAHKSPGLNLKRVHIPTLLDTLQATVGNNAQTQEITSMASWALRTPMIQTQDGSYDLSNQTTQSQSAKLSLKLHNTAFGMASSKYCWDRSAMSHIS